jgi:hypothetical protein
MEPIGEWIIDGVKYPMYPIDLSDMEGIKKVVNDFQKACEKYLAENGPIVWPIEGR